MKKLIYSLLVLTAMTACTSSNTETSEETEMATEATLTNGDYTVDAAASEVMWKGVLLGVKEHFGTVSVTEGNFSVADGSVSGGKITIDMNTMVPTDSTYDAESTKEKLVGHLSSPDFFDVANFPSATFEVTGAEGNKVMGNLTVRGKTNPETVENVTVTADGITGDLTFNRKNYDVKFDLPMKDMVLSDDIKLSFSLKATK